MKSSSHPRFAHRVLKASTSFHNNIPESEEGAADATATDASAGDNGRLPAAVEPEEVEEIALNESVNRFKKLANIRG